MEMIIIIENISNIFQVFSYQYLTLFNFNQVIKVLNNQKLTNVLYFSIQQLMLRRLLAQHRFSKSVHPQNLSNIDSHIESLAKQYKQILKQKQSISRNSKLLDNIRTISSLYQKKKRIKMESIKQQQLGIVKQYLASKVVEPNRAEEGRFIPLGLTLNKLEYKNHTVLLVGINKVNQEHGMFVQDLVKRLDIKLLMTQIPPDWPYFIKTTQPFETAWHRFITRKAEYSFYLNPKPQTLTHVLLDSHKIPLFKNTLLKSSSFTELSGICVELDQKTQKFETNSFLAGLFCPKLQNMVCFDYPILREREYQALTLSLETLRQLFRTYLYKVQEESHLNFDPRLLHYDKMLRPRIQYMTRIIKLGSSTFPKTIAICDQQYSHLICEEWKNPLPKNHVIFNFPTEETLVGEKKRGYLEHIQKLVILDTILNPLIGDFFMEHNVFPFRCEGFVGAEELNSSVRILWDFYSKKYRDAVENNKPIDYSGYPQKA